MSAPLKAATRVSWRGRRFICAREGAVPFAYNDSRNNATFGVGHLLHLGPVTADDQRRWGTRQHPKSMRLVRGLLAKDLAGVERAIRDGVHIKLHAYQFDALASLAFNIGIAGFLSSTVVRDINKGRGDDHLHQAAEAFLLWDKPPELLPRRHLEAHLFLTGHYA
jgi:lysozyme